MEQQRVVALTDEHWDDLNPIYVDSFPPAERVPADRMRSLIRTGERDGLTVLDPATGSPIGLAITIPLEFVRFLEYLAVDASHRGSGLGTLMMRELLRTLDEAGLRALVWEIDSTSVASTPAEHEVRLRRAEFYRRLGGSPCFALGRKFRTPAFDGGVLDLELWEHPI
ncbi:MAG: GNAT family N-acetyltransferase, partial [Myxococcales bacterium]|nr:GNAT family N-acetyltransferase [Myxococcales bacterium]